MPTTTTPAVKRGLYIITDCARLDYPEMLARTGLMLRAGVAAVQYRDKNPDEKTRRRIAEQLHDLCQRHATPLIINDDVATALAVQAEGVHLGREDTGQDEARRCLPEGTLIGVSCYNDLPGAARAQAAGADYVAFGAVFPTRTKDKTVPASLELLTRARAELTIPVAAIGGITTENCRSVLAAGADLLAVISSVYLADDPTSAVRRFNEIIFKK
jgi:thiamine-phosphate pyrophosphorylase